MLLGKRPRPPIKRTTSVTGINGDLTTIEPPEPSDLPNPIKEPENPVNQNTVISDRRRNSGDFIETASFLRTCGLCCRRLASGRDIYMYKGDTGFCSLECREQRMKQDERNEKYAAVSKSENHHSSPASTVCTNSACKSETVAAA